jgi:hypothetical protein
MGLTKQTITATKSLKQMHRRAAKDFFAALLLIALREASRVRSSFRPLRENCSDYAKLQCTLLLCLSR